jgi:hypothetical protein
MTNPSDGLRLVAAYGESSRVRALLDRFIADQRCMPQGATPIAPESLPESLQRLAGRASETEHWRAWSSANGDIAFVRGKVSSTFSLRLSRPALHVFFHDRAGEIVSSGTYAQNEAGRWERCEIPLPRPGRRRKAGLAED